MELCFNSCVLFGSGGPKTIPHIKANGINLLEIFKIIKQPEQKFLKKGLPRTWQPFTCTAILYSPERLAVNLILAIFAWLGSLPPS